MGTFAVQLAKVFGAEVTALCSTKKLDLVRSIGADHVIDYTKEDFVRRPHRYDLILAVAGNRSMLEYRRTMKPVSSWVQIGGGSGFQMLGAVLAGPLLSAIGNKRMVTMMAKANQADLLTLGTYLEAGKIKPVIDRSYTLDEVPEAIRYLEEGHARGQAVIDVGPPA